MNRRAQIWYLDVFIAVSILVIVSAIYFQTIDTETTAVSGLEQDSQAIAGLLVSPGYPTDWNSTTVVIPGVVESYTINQTKIQALYSFNHSYLQALYQTTNNVYIYMSTNNSVLNVSVANGAGRPPTDAAKNIAQTQRLALYQNRPVTVHVVVWSI